MTTVQQRTLLQIQAEHEVLRTVLRAINRIVTRARHQHCPPDFVRLRYLLREAVELPERGHHAKESQLLFPLLREKCPPLAPVLDRLEAEHRRVEQLLSDVERALADFEAKGETRLASFDSAIKRYVDESLGHIQVEEDYILPVAGDYLTELDWIRIDAWSVACDRSPLSPASPKRQSGEM